MNASPSKRGAARHPPVTGSASAFAIVLPLARPLALGSLSRVGPYRNHTVQQLASRVNSRSGSRAAVPAMSGLWQLSGHKQTTHGRCLHECSRPRSGLLKSVQETTAVVGADGSCGASLSGPRKGCSQRQQQELERVQSHDEPILPGSSAAHAHNATRSPASACRVRPTRYHLSNSRGASECSKPLSYCCR
jgi:hypothetical protein